MTYIENLTQASNAENLLLCGSCEISDLYGLTLETQERKAQKQIKAQYTISLFPFQTSSQVIAVWLVRLF